MVGQLSFTLLSALAWGQLSNALVPADPTITAPAVLPRQNNDRFMGYVETNGTWYSQQCNSGLTWFQDGKYAQCCPATLASCYAPTACVDGYLYYPKPDLSTTQTIHCTDNYGIPAASICNTIFIFENMNVAAAQTDIVCGASSQNWSLYRKIPASLTEIISSNPPTSIIAESTAPAAATPTPTDNAKEQEKNNNNDSGGSKAWIAGAVVGPVVGIALIAAGAFFFLRRKKKSKAAGAYGAPGAGNAPAGVAVGGQGFSDAKPQMGQPGYSQPVGAAGYGNPQDRYSQFGQSSVSPATQYSNMNSPQGAYAPDGKTTYAYDPNQNYPQASELGTGASPQIPGAHSPGPGSPPPGIAQHNAPQAAELGGAHTHTAELPSHNGPK